MSAPMATHVRIKVYFENNEFDASWLLIDTKELRTMKDVQRYISSKFLGKTVPLFLTLQGCFLPDWEKSVILRDNDCINAKCVHVDSYDSPTILLSPTDINEEKVRKSHKKKKLKDKRKEKDNEEHEECGKESHNIENVTRERVENRSEENTSKEHGLETVDMETNVSPPKHKQKKKKHKHDKDQAENDSKSEKSRKRKLEAEKQIELSECVTTVPEPLTKKVAIDMSSISVKQGLNVPGNLERCDETRLTVDDDKLRDGSDAENEKESENKPKRKRKRVRKRKNKNAVEKHVAVDKSLTDNSFYTNLNNTWNWGTGYQDNSMGDAKESENKKHMKFQSDESDNENDSTNTVSLEVKNRTNNSYSYERESDKQSFTKAAKLSKSESPFKSPAQINTRIQNGNSFNGDGNAGYDSQPSVLSTSYLTNGVAVYSRNRGKQQQNLKQYTELSKEAQINSKLENVSVIIQNTSKDEIVCVEPEKIYQAEKIDYNKFPALIGPPRIGDRLAYKVIELSEDYTPEVSDYKEAVVCSYNPESKTVELESEANKAAKQRLDGKFEVTFDDDDDEFSTEAELKVCLPLESLIEPKLIS